MWRRRRRRGSSLRGGHSRGLGQWERRGTVGLMVGEVIEGEDPIVGCSVREMSTTGSWAGLRGSYTAIRETRGSYRWSGGGFRKTRCSSRKDREEEKASDKEMGLQGVDTGSAGVQEGILHLSPVYTVLKAIFLLAELTPPLCVCVL